MTDLALDLNQAITGAVNARIEAEVAKALAGDEIIGRLVTSALQQKVTDRDAYYRTREQTFLASVLEKTIQEVTKNAVTKVIQERSDHVEQLVRNALEENLEVIASTLTKSLIDAADKPYGIAIELKMAGRD